MLLERSAGLLVQGYPWASRVRAGASAAPLRFLGRRSVVVGGPEGVRRFYDPRLRRRGALPPPVKLVLFGPGAVHGLDDAEHHHRKALFTGLLGPDAAADVARRSRDGWREAVAGWRGKDRVVLHDEAVRVIGTAVLAWAGVQVPPQEAARRARQMAAVVEGFGSVSPLWLRAATDRVLLDRWAARLVREVRSGARSAAPGSALHAAATATDLAGRPLPARTAAVELLNVLRPTTAVAWFVDAAGAALGEHPDWRERIAGGDTAALGAFAHEVRRRSPFVPALAARAREAQDVLGVPVPRGGFVVLDVHGTDHDPAHWADPERFDPARFLHGPSGRDVGLGGVDPDALVPQGGGDVATGHRCPGEDVVLDVLGTAVFALARSWDQLPPLETRTDPRRLPPRPHR